MRSVAFQVCAELGVEDVDGFIERRGIVGTLEWAAHFNVQAERLEERIEQAKAEAELEAQAKRGLEDVRRNPLI